MHQPANTEYQHLLTTLKEKIRNARVTAILSVNTQLLAIYWEIGKVILAQQKNEGWGAKIIDRLAADLKTEFPDETGFSVRNLKYMRAFAEAYPTLQLSQAFLTQLKNNENHLDIKLQNEPAKIVQPTVAQLSQLSNTQFVQSLNLARVFSTRVLLSASLFDLRKIHISDCGYLNHQHHPY